MDSAAAARRTASGGAGAAYMGLQVVTERPQSPRVNEPVGASSQLDQVAKGVNWGVMSIVLVVCFNTVSPLLREATKGARGKDFRMNPNTVMFLEEILKYLITLGCLVFVELQGGGGPAGGTKGEPPREVAG